MTELTITKYIALDGKEFEDETECMEYESDLILYNLNGGFRMWDINGDELEHLGSFTIDKIWYVYIKNEKAYELFKSQSDYYGLSFPILTEEDEYKGSFYWDGEKDKWISVAKRIKTLQNEIDNLKKYLTD